MFKKTDLTSLSDSSPSSLQTPGSWQGLDEALQNPESSSSYAAPETSGSSLFNQNPLDFIRAWFSDSPPSSFSDSSSKNNQTSPFEWDSNGPTDSPFFKPETVPFQDSDNSNQQSGSDFVFSESPFAFDPYSTNATVASSDTAKPAAYSYADTNAYQDGSLSQGSVRYGAVADWGASANYNTQFNTDTQILPGVDLKTDGTVDAHAGISACAAGEVGLSFSPDGIQTYAQGDLAAAANASANTNLNATAAIPGLDTSVGAGGQGHADAFAGAQVAGQIGVAVSPDDASVNMNGGGFAGAKASVDASGALSLNGEQLAEIHGDAGVRAGIGASGKLDAGYDNGTLHLDMGAGLALGLGAEADWGVSVQVPDFVGDQIVGEVKATTDMISGAVDAGSDLVSGVSDAASDLASSVDDTFSDLASGNLGDAVTDLGSGVLDAGYDIASSVLDAGYDVASGAVDAAIDLGTGVVNTVSDVASDVVDVASDVVSTVSKALPWNW